MSQRVKRKRLSSTIFEVHEKPGEVRTVSAENDGTLFRLRPRRRGKDQDLRGNVRKKPVLSEKRRADLFARSGFRWEGEGRVLSQLEEGWSTVACAGGLETNSEIRGR